MDRIARPRVRLDTSLELLLEHAPADAGARVLATLVATAGSTYRKPGARMLIMADGNYLGLLSGGCLEADLALHAREILRSGVARAVEYDMRGPDDVLFGVGAGCAGALRVLLEPAGPGSLASEALPKAAQVTGAGGATSVIAVHESPELALGTYDAAAALPPYLTLAARQALDGGVSREIAVDTAAGRTRAFVQFLAPLPCLLICGAGTDAQPVAAAAVALGWRVSVVDHRPAYAVAARFPGADVRHGAAAELPSVIDLQRCHAAVVMSHHLPSDTAYLRALADAGAPAYVGLLGPRARRQRIFEALGTDADRLQYSIRGPVGIDIGAATPQGIALSIVSQIHEWLAFPDREAPIQPRPLGSRAP